MSTLKPILFSTPMVQAIMEGSKTMTRRIIKPQPTFIESSGRWVWPIPKSKIKPGCCESVCSASREWYEYLLPEQLQYQLGDVLWVRETWLEDTTDEKEWFYVYKANNEQYPIGSSKWRPSIFMPKAACRIFLEITDIRVERLQEIREEDAIAEGIAEWTKLHKGPIFCFKSLWESINGLESWKANPFVWVVSFTRIDKPENF